MRSSDVCKSLLMGCESGDKSAFTPSTRTVRLLSHAWVGRNGSPSVRPRRGDTGESVSVGRAVGQRYRHGWHRAALRVWLRVCRTARLISRRPQPLTSKPASQHLTNLDHVNLPKYHPAPIVKLINVKRCKAQNWEATGTTCRIVPSLAIRWSHNPGKPAQNGSHTRGS